MKKINFNQQFVEFKGDYYLIEDVKRVVINDNKCSLHLYTRGITSSLDTISTNNKSECEKLRESMKRLS